VERGLPGQNAPARLSGGPSQQAVVPHQDLGAVEDLGQIDRAGALGNAIPGDGGCDLSAAEVRDPNTDPGVGDQVILDDHVLGVTADDDALVRVREPVIGNSHVV